jgi:branched-chain amino acid transport system ATP-binding protein
MAAGEVVSLLGRNGMGKTTTISSITGILPPRGGKVLIGGIEVTGWPSFRIARRGVGLVPEGRQIFPNLTVRENLLAMAGNWIGKPDPWDLETTLHLFPTLRTRLDSSGSVLSGGEQQMLAIGRALMTNPQLLILDEATEGLAPLIREQIWRVLARLKAAGQSILIVDKNIKALGRIADRHYVLEKGRIIWSGGTAELREHPELQRRYLGV